MNENENNELAERRMREPLRAPSFNKALGFQLWERVSTNVKTCLHGAVGLKHGQLERNRDEQDGRRAGQANRDE